jgi:putative PIN family toxin of toxin-antitoxin system
LRAHHRNVIDTNAIVSAAILANSVPRQAVERVLTRDILLLSEQIFDELTEVLFRSRFDDYVSVRERELFLVQLAKGAEFIPIIQKVRECRDPNDDKFLELALNGSANVIITGDKGLLVLNPWREVAIVTPADYLKRR